MNRELERTVVCEICRELRSIPAGGSICMNCDELELTEPAPEPELDQKHVQWSTVPWVMR